jgi:hypothetical protein
MYSIDYRLANALQERRLDEAARLHEDSQDSQLAEPQRQSWPSRKLRPWLCGLGVHLIEFGSRLERQALAVQASQE